MARPSCGSCPCPGPQARRTCSAGAQPAAWPKLSCERRGPRPAFVSGRNELQGEDAMFHKVQAVVILCVALSGAVRAQCLLLPSPQFAVGDYPYSVASADLDADGDRDLTVANTDADTVSVLLNQGNGKFAVEVEYAVGDLPHSVTSADLDGDGDLDLAVANANPDTVSVLLNDGDGTFAVQLPYGVGDFPFTVTSADLDGDGDADLATANTLSSTV